MPKVYDDWERLVRATIRREEIWQLCHDHSRTPSSGSTTSGSSPGSSSPAPDLAPKRPTARASPLTRQSGAVVPVNSSAPLTQRSGAETNQVVVPGSSSTPLSSLNPLSEREIKNDKWVRRRKSRIRLDRWVWTRWLSNTFSTQKTGNA